MVPFKMGIARPSCGSTKRWPASSATGRTANATRFFAAGVMLFLSSSLYAQSPQTVRDHDVYSDAILTSSTIYGAEATAEDFGSGAATVPETAPLLVNPARTTSPAGRERPPPLSVDYWFVGPGTFSDTDTSMLMNNFSVGYMLGVPLGSVILTAEPKFDVLFLSGPGEGGPDLPEQLYGFSVNLAVMKRFGDRWMVRAGVSPGIYTDFENTSSEAYRFPAMLFATYTMNERWTFMGGVVYTSQEDLPIIPAAGFIWNASERWRFELLLPRPRVLYHVRDGLDVYALFAFTGSTYAIRSNQVDDVFQYRDFRFALGSDWKLPTGNPIVTEVGLAFARNLEFNVLPDWNIEPGFYARIGTKF